MRSIFNSHIDKLINYADNHLLFIKSFFSLMLHMPCSVGVAEKGSLTLEMSVHTSGGHSSMPPRETCIGILSQAVSRLLRKINSTVQCFSDYFSDLLYICNRVLK